MKRVPLALAACAEDEFSAGTLAWPIAYAKIRRRQVSLTEITYRRLADLADGEFKELCVLVAISLGWWQREIGWLGMIGLAAQENGWRITDPPPILNFLLTGEDRSAFASATVPLPEHITFPWLRRAARTATLNRTPIRTLSGFFAPQAHVLSHNSLLRDFTRTSSKQLSFLHGSKLLEDARRTASPVVDNRLIDDAVAFYSSLLSEAYTFPPAVDDRAREAFRMRARIIIEEAARDLAALRSYPRLPTEIWSGSCGRYVTRATVLAVRSNGGRAIGFDHGGSGVMVSDVAFFSLCDLSLRDQFVTTTPAASEFIRRANSLPKYLSTKETTFQGASGDPLFRRASTLPSRRKNRASRPRILFVNTIYTSLRQQLPPLLPDVLSISLQRQILDAISDLNVDLAVKPHPEGNLQNSRHPLAEFAEIDERPFVEALEDADLLMFDYPQTTTFWETVCTDRSILFFDTGVSQFHAQSWELLQERCHVLKVEWNEEFFPTIDPPRLRTAVNELLDTSVDNSDMRALLAGNTDI